ncbi:MAG: hypothetical protein AAF945_20065 [Actinomycetota bacterium]
MTVARVLPDVTGLDKEFDYLVPEDLTERVTVGTIVRVELHGRRVGGWVVDLLDAIDSEVDSDQLKPIAKVTGHGPGRDLIDLARWAEFRWAARRIRPFLVAASPKRAIVDLPESSRRAIAPAPSSPATTRMLDAGGGVLRLPPRVDVLPSVLSAVSRGPALVVAPTAHDARLIGARARRAGCTVAVVPDDWRAAAGGVDLVVGGRSAAWMPCAGMASAIVIDEHDEALQEERTPTWHARDVVAERCRRAGVPAVFVSPSPSLVAVERLAGPDGVVHPPGERERAGWPTVEVVARTDEDPWKRSLLTSALIQRLRDHDLRIACLSNTTGRARVLACRTCRALTRCENCDAAVALDDDGRLVCARCGTTRAAVCQSCGASRFANLRPGVTRLREELEAAAGRRVVSVTGADDEPPPRADVYVGTEALLYRIDPVDVVVFLEFDSEMLAPRMRASEQALALVIRAGRLAPEVMIQTFHPDHEVIRAVRTANPNVVIEGERSRRRSLGWPPYGAVASVTGAFADDLVAGLDRTTVEVGGSSGAWIVRSDSWERLGHALRAVERPPGARVRVEVDPPRL